LVELKEKLPIFPVKRSMIFVSREFLAWDVKGVDMVPIS